MADMVVKKGKVVHIGRLHFRAGDAISEEALPPNVAKGLVDAGIVEKKINRPNMPSTEDHDELV